MAVLEHAELHKELEVATAFQKVDEIPFDFQRRRMSVAVAEQTLFQSGWFVVGLLTQTLIVHMIRTPTVPFILAPYFRLQALPLTYFPILIAILLGYITLTQLLKGVYVHQCGWH